MLEIKDKSGNFVKIDRNSLDIGGKVNFYNLENVDDIPDDSTFSIGMGTANLFNVPQGLIMFNITWIKLELAISNDGVSIRNKYGNNGWSEWAKLITFKKS